MRTVTRTWISKKTGQVRTRTYQYKGSNKSTRGKTLVGKNGVINKKNIENFKQSIDNNLMYNEAEKRMLKADLNAIVAQRHKDKKKLTTTGFLGKQQEDKVSRFFVNAGYSLEEAAEEMEIDIQDLLDEENWDGNKFTFAGVVYAFDFTYTGDFWKRIQ